MQSATELLATYKSAHLNKVNIVTHCVGIPLIILALMMLLYLVKVPIGASFTLPLATLLIAAVIAYYFFLHRPLAVGATLFTAALYAVAIVLIAKVTTTTLQAVIAAIVIFIVGWAFQFIGHHYEKAKPAFFDDVKQLLIGPLFLVAELFFALGFNRELHSTINERGRQKRRAIESAKQNN